MTDDTYVERALRIGEDYWYNRQRFTLNRSEFHQTVDTYGAAVGILTLVLFEVKPPQTIEEVESVIESWEK